MEAPCTLSFDKVVSWSCATGDGLARVLCVPCVSSVASMQSASKDTAAKTETLHYDCAMVGASHL